MTLGIRSHIAVIAGRTLRACAVIVLVSSFAHAGSAVVVGEGESGCWATRKTALSFANSSTRNDASSECRALGGRLGKEKSTGYEQCTSCQGDGIRCKYTSRSYECVGIKDKSPSAEPTGGGSAHLPAADAKPGGQQPVPHREKAAAPKLPSRAKDSRISGAEIADKQTPGKRPATIDDAFAKLEKRSEDQARAEATRRRDKFDRLEREGSASAGSVDDKFAKLEGHRAEQQHKAEVAQAEQARQNQARSFCEATFKDHESCVNTACGPEKEKFDAQCKAVPSKPQPYSQCMNNWAGCLNCSDEQNKATLENRCRGADEKLSDWTRQWGDIRTQCENPVRHQIRTASCMAKAGPRCDALKKTSASSVDDCVSQRLGAR